MNPNREELLFGLALTKPATERAAFLDRECGADDALRHRLESLLAAHEASNELQATKAEAALPTLKIEIAEEPPDEAVGQTIGRYKLLEKVGEGGCGVVYVAEQTEPVRRRVALKVIKLGMDTKQVVARFEAERQALAMMDHPNIAKVLDAGTTEDPLTRPPGTLSPSGGEGRGEGVLSAGRPYFVMELVRGIRITDYCDQANLRTKDRLDLFIKVCQAIQHAHQKGVIHRDIKPSNILVTLHDGVPVPKVIDFGIAKATEGRLTDATVYTQLHQFIGTPAYMSPEQAEMSGLDIDTRSDIYSLGVLLYELLAGSTPFDAKELMASGIDAMRKTIREKEPVRPSTKLSQTLVAADVRGLKSPSSDTPGSEEEVRASSRRLLRIKETIVLLRGDLDWIVMKCLEKDRARRYETANGLAADLKRHLTNEPVVARPPSTAYRFQKAFRRNKLMFTAATAVAAALVVGVAVSTWQAVRARRAENVQSRLYGEAEQARANEAVQRHKAEIAREQTETSAQIARQNLYAADMSLVQQALQANNLGRARRLLDRNRPETGEQDLRGWEWRYLWQQCRSRAITTLARHTTRAISVNFSADSQLLAVGYGDGRLEVWDVPSRKLTSVLKTNGPAGPVRFAPRGRLLAQPGGGASLQLYDLASGEPPVAIEMDEGYVRAFSFSRDGSLLICFTSMSGLKVVDLGRREIISTKLPAGFMAHQPGGGDVRFPPGGMRYFAAIHRGDSGPASELSVGVFRPQEGVLEHEFMVGTDQHLSTMDLSLDGRFLATGTGFEHSTIRVWDAQTFKPIARLDAHTAWIPELMFSPDGRTLASASGDQTIRLWDTQTWQELAVLRGHGNEVWSVAFSPDGKLLASGAKDGEVLLWSATATPSADTRFVFPSHVHSAAILPREPAVLTLSTNGVCSVWGVPSLTETALPFAPNSIQFFWPPNYLGGYDQTNFVRLYAVQHSSTRLVGEFPVGPRATRIIYLPEERTLFWQDNSGKPQRLLVGEDSATTMQTGRGKTSPDGKLEAFPSESGVATLRERATKRTVMELRGHLLAVDGVAFTPDGKRLATTSGGREAVKLWDTATGQELLNLPGHGMNLYNAEFSEDGNVLLVGWLGAGFWQLWQAPPWTEIEKIERNGGGWPRLKEP